MLWYLDNPKAEETRRGYERKNEEVPNELYPPEILEGYQPWYDAFWELGTDRSFGMAVGPIPARSIENYTYGWDVGEAEKFRLVIRHLDSVYLKRTNRRKPEAGDSASGAETPPVVDETETFSRDHFRAAFKGRMK